MIRNETLIVIPAHNEALHIQETLSKLQPIAELTNADVLVVDDGSNDGTAMCARRCGVPCISLPFHSGYGTTLQTAYKFAVRNQYHYLVQIDADGQHDPRFIPVLLEALHKQEADVVIGTRFLSPDDPPFMPWNKLYRGTFFRRVGIALFRLILRIWGIYVTDPTSGYIGFRRNVFQFLSSDVFPFDYPDADVILLLDRNGYSLKEIPVFMYENSDGGKLHRGAMPLWYVVKEFLALFFTSVRKRESG